MQEIGIAKFSLTVAGHWRAEPPGRDGLTVDGYFEALSPCDDPMWFRAEATGNGIVIKSRSGASTTLGVVELRIGERRERAGIIKFRLTGGNVTRTLHHLLVMYGYLGPQFVAVVSQLNPSQFFMSAPGGVPLAFGNADNWISDYAVMHTCLGEDPFGEFQQIYVHQLQRMVGWLVLPFDTGQIIPDGASLFSRVPGIECRMDWGQVRFQQVEAYFERRHSHAMGAVRLLATAALVDFDDAQVWRYFTNDSLWAERTGDNLSVGFSLRKTYRLAVYAKVLDRIRFEMRRNGGAPLPSSEGVQTPETRLLEKFQRERDSVLDAAQWHALGTLLDEHPAPQMSDFVTLCHAAHRASNEHGVSYSALLTALLEDGGLQPNGANGWTDALLADLRRAGILHRPVIRRRDHREPNKRLALRPEYRGLLNLVSRSLLDGHGLIAERA